MEGHSNTRSSDDEACMHALSLLGGFTVPLTLMAVIELGLIDQLLASDGRPMSAQELVARLPCPAPAKSTSMADRMLRFLAAYRVVRCGTEVGPDGQTRQTYTAAPVCKWLAGNGGEDSVVPFGLMMLNKTVMESWYHLKAAVLEGEAPFRIVTGMPLYQYVGSKESVNKLFNQAMTSHSAITTKKLVDFFHSFQDIDVLVNVGGGSGTTLQMIRDKYKNVRGINYDLPHVISQAIPIEGVEHVGGSMFDNIPQGNAVLLKWILHNWGDNDCVKILKNCYKALPLNGKVILVEYILPESPEPELKVQDAFKMDLAMLVLFASGKERTVKEFSALAMEAGFSDECKTTYIFANVWALEFTK